MSELPAKLVTMGRVSGLYGVRGWVRVFSHTDPRGNIVRYRPWYLKLNDRWQRVDVAAGREHGKSVLAKIEGVDDRDEAAALLGAEIAIDRRQLPEPAPGEYYWVDLEGLSVVTTEGVELGVVDHLMETGANDVLVVRGERERLIPYLPERVVKEIDLENGWMRVDWDPEF